MSENKHGLTPEQYHELLSENDAPLESIIHQGLKTHIWAVLIILVALVVLGNTVLIPQEINVPFVLRQKEPKTVVRFAEDTWVKASYTSSGAVLKKGDPILTISSPKITQAIEEINQIKLTLDFEREKKTKYTERERELLAAELSDHAQVIQSATKEIEKLKTFRQSESLSQSDQIKLMEAAVDRNRKLYDQQAISLADYENSQRELAAIKEQVEASNSRYVNELNLLQNRIELAELHSHRLKQQITTLIMGQELSIEELEHRLANTQKMLEVSYGSFDIHDTGLTLKSPAEGTLSFISEPESIVEAGNIVYQMDSDESDYYVHSELSSAEVGHAQPGQQVVIKYESFPHFYYGAMYGEIATIATSPNEKGLFSVNVHITDEANLQGKVNNGMQGEMAILVEELTLFQIAYKTFTKKSLL